MKSQLQPWHLVLLILAGWINRKQQQALEYLLTENRILRNKLGKKRILLNDDQRLRLVVKDKILGRKMLEELAGEVGRTSVSIGYRRLLGGLLRYYYREAASPSMTNFASCCAGRRPGVRSGPLSIPAPKTEPILVLLPH